MTYRGCLQSSRSFLARPSQPRYGNEPMNLTGLSIGSLLSILAHIPVGTRAIADG